MPLKESVSRSCRRSAARTADPSVGLKPSVGMTDVKHGLRRWPEGQLYQIVQSPKG